MPDSSFFEPIAMPTDGFGQMKPRYTADPKFTAGYRNVYGTKIGANVSPITNQAGLDFQFPIGDHQKQTFFTGGAYARPSSSEAPSDWGVRLGFKKNITPQGMTGGQMINAVLQQQLGDDSNQPVLNASNRESFLNSLTPDQLKLLRQNAETINRQYVDKQLGIRPGAEKFGFDVGVDVQQRPEQNQMDSGMMVPGIAPQQFVRDYAQQVSNRNPKAIGSEYGSSLGGF